MRKQRKWPSVNQVPRTPTQSVQQGTPSQQVSRPSEQHEDNQNQGEQMVRGIPQMPKATKNSPLHAVLEIQEGHRDAGPMAGVSADTTKNGPYTTAQIPT